MDEKNSNILSRILTGFSHMFDLICHAYMTLFESIGVAAAAAAVSDHWRFFRLGVGLDQAKLIVIFENQA